MSQVGDMLAKTGISMPSMGGVFFWIIGFLLLVLIIIIMAGFAWWIFNKLTYNKKIKIFEKVGQRFQHTGSDVAREFAITETGEKVLFLKKRKVWKVGEAQASPKTFWFAILADGYWYNFTLGDFNEKLGTFEISGINPEMHKLMRYQNAGLRKNLAERHLKKKWWEHPLVGWIGAIIFVLIVGILFFLIGKQLLSDLPKTLELQNQILERIHNLIQMFEQTGCKP